MKLVGKVDRWLMSRNTIFNVNLSIVTLKCFNMVMLFLLAFEYRLLSTEKGQLFNFHFPDNKYVWKTQMTL